MERISKVSRLERKGRVIPVSTEHQPKHIMAARPPHDEIQ